MKKTVVCIGIALGTTSFATETMSPERLICALIKKGSRAALEDLKIEVRGPNAVLSSKDGQDLNAKIFTLVKSHKFTLTGSDRTHPSGKIQDAFAFLIESQLKLDEIERGEPFDAQFWMTRQDFSSGKEEHTVLTNGTYRCEKL